MSTPELEKLIDAIEDLTLTYFKRFEGISGKLRPMAGEFRSVRDLLTNYQRTILEGRAGAEAREFVADHMFREHKEGGSHQEAGECPRTGLNRCCDTDPAKCCGATSSGKRCNCTCHGTTVEPGDIEQKSGRDVDPKRHGLSAPTPRGSLPNSLGATSTPVEPLGQLLAAAFQEGFMSAYDTDGDPHGSAFDQLAEAWDASEARAALTKEESRG